MKTFFLSTVAIICIPALLITQPCLPDGIIFNSQAQLDSFQILYPNCTEIEGNVHIHQISDIHDLSPLSNITAIGGYIWVSSHYIDSLYGLNNLESIGSWLSLFGGNYVDLDELGSLRSIQGGLQVASCDGLVDLSGLDSLEYLGSGLYISGSVHLKSLDGLQWIDSIHENFRLMHLPSLESLEGMNNLEYIGGDMEWIDNPSLSNLNSLVNLTRVDGKIEINNCDSLIDLQGMNKLQTIVEGLYIKNCYNLQSLEGLDELLYIGDEFYLWQNHSLENLDALENLTEIGSDINIVINNSLVDLNGLNSLVDIGHKLMIFSNDLLSDISGLENLGGNQLEELIIISNPSLSECSIQIVCDFLETGSEALIAGNMTGCATVEEVEEGCETGLVEPGLSNSITIYPNPATDIIHITIPSRETIERIGIYNTGGQLLIQHLTSKPALDISSLNPGMYICEVGFNGTSTRKLFVKTD